MRRFILTGVGVFVLIVLLIVFFANRGNKPQPVVSVNKNTDLTQYAETSTQVRFTQNGQIIAREDHRVLQITIGQNERTATIFEGYQGKVLKSQTYLNDVDAYRAFLASLHNNGYTNHKEPANKFILPLGACSSGLRYNYDIINSTDTIQSLWGTSCGGEGTFAGRSSNVRTLFRNQIPNYNDFIKDVRFSN